MKREARRTRGSRGCGARAQKKEMSPVFGKLARQGGGRGNFREWLAWFSVLRVGGQGGFVLGQDAARASNFEWVPASRLDQMATSGMVVGRICGNPPFKRVSTAGVSSSCFRQRIGSRTSSSSCLLRKKHRDMSFVFRLASLSVFCLSKKEKLLLGPSAQMQIAAGRKQHSCEGGKWSRAEARKLRE